MKLKLICSVLFFLPLFNSISYSQWIQQTNGLQFWSRGEAIDACNNNTAIIAVDNFIYKTENSGNSWTAIPFPAFATQYGNVSIYEAVVDISIIDNSHFWICTDAGRILATSNGGINWSVQFYDTAITPFINYVKMFDVNNGIAMGDTKNIISHDSVPGPAIFLRTTNGGDNWFSVNDSAFGGFSGGEWRRLDFININTGYFRESGLLPQKLFKTTNGGKNWLSTNFPSEGGELVKFYDENLGLVVNMDYQNPNISWQMCRTTDGGNSWETFSMNSKEYPDDIEFVPTNPSKVWYVDLGSLYYSSDTGRTWTEQKIYNGKLWGRDIVFTDSTHGWLLCDSGKLFYTSNNGGVVSGIPINKIQIPSEYFLMQNYPNPFNPSTEISYQLSTASFIMLKVYDVLGREVKSLVNENQNAGFYKVEFNAGSLPSGIYIYRIIAGKFSALKKCVLIK
ncbi:MAG: T9SS type A sorting domain-containing protein [Ignavibacteriaceae bacterium]